MTAQTDAWTAQTGIGYDIRVGGHSMLTVYANYLRTFAGATWFNGVSSAIAVMPNAIYAELYYDYLELGAQRAASDYVIENGYASHGCIGVPDDFASRLFAIAKKGDRVIITNGQQAAIGTSLAAR